ncbi:hypothetical protein E2C01_050744 [Portunus trituberculatus]|uniref:Uncharacterized protein n=1 Tax=Portunus trituberculatus TaxID=210409 RepID=A0A5B7GIC0_PORTR|nr:hypothetical protein [Portunus trituberculatus]
METFSGKHSTKSINSKEKVSTHLKCCTEEGRSEHQHLYATTPHRSGSKTIYSATLHGMSCSPPLPLILSLNLDKATTALHNTFTFPLFKNSCSSGRLLLRNIQ